MKIRHYILIALVAGLVSSCNKGEIDFSYSPAEPRCGQSISFSNLSTKGDSDSKWKWEFGDGNTSESKNTSKTYRQAGVYVVTLTLDGKSFQRASKEITVYDSIPSFSASSDSIGTFEEVTFTPLTYNPSGLTLTYRWDLPENTVVTSETSKGVITLYFTKETDNAEITLHTFVGSNESVKTISYKVYDTPAASVIMSTSDGQLLQQKLYSLALMEPDTITPEGVTLTNARQLLIDGNTMFIFEQRSGEDGAIYAMNLDNGATEVVIRNAASVTDYLYSTGMVNGGYLYFADIANKNVYRVKTDTRNAVFTDGADILFASESTLSGFTSGVCGGVDVFGSLYYMGSTSGIYRFTEADINSGAAPATEQIATDQAPLNLKIDALAGKIYTVEDKSLFVRNIDGSYPHSLADGIESSWAFCINNSLNRMVFATETGVMSMPLVQTKNNTTTAEATKLNDIPAIGVVIDEVMR